MLTSKASIDLPSNQTMGEDAELSHFFAAFRAKEEAAATGLQTFFQEFDTSFRKARIGRVGTIPHFNLLQVFGIEYAELCHSNALAWFLSPNAEHEQGALFANALLSHLGTDPLPDESYQVMREKHGRTDVALYSKTRVAVFVENKVRHVETEMQVSNMIDSLTILSGELGIPREQRFALFLTDAGAAAATGPKADSPGFLLKNLRSITRMELFRLFESALLAQPQSSPLLRGFVDFYLNSIHQLRAQLI